MLKQETIEDWALSPAIPPPITGDPSTVIAPLFEQVLSTEFSAIIPAIPPTFPALPDTEKLTAHLLWQLMIFPLFTQPATLPR